LIGVLHSSAYATALPVEPMASVVQL
jgi:hypothetical protein